MKNIIAFLISIFVASTAMAADKPKKDDNEPILPVQVKRDVSCSSVNLDRDKLKDWTVERVGVEATDLESKFNHGINTVSYIDSVVHFPTTISEDAFVEIKAKATMLWRRGTGDNRQTTETQQIFYGADKKPLELHFRHKDFFEVEKVEILSVKCNRFVVDASKLENFCSGLAICQQQPPAKADAKPVEDSATIPDKTPTSPAARKKTLPAKDDDLPAVLP